MFLMFQAVFAWSEAPIAWIEGLVAASQDGVASAVAPGFLRSLLVDGVLGGVGAVIVFLPQILILFAFILLLEATGYMVRAAFLMDRVMERAGLSGHAFIPLLSSFACAVPGIMATRTIEDPKHRLTTILVAPLMTCSARLPVYAIIIGAFIPARSVGPGIGLQGLVLFGLYAAGIVGALLAALVLRRTVTKGAPHGFMMEMPKYQMPHLRDLALGLWQRAMIFLKRAGSIILVSTIILWALLVLPAAAAGLGRNLARQLDRGQDRVGARGRRAADRLQPRDRSGFGPGDGGARGRGDRARDRLFVGSDRRGQDRADPRRSGCGAKWTLPTALAFLAWFVFAPQCLSTVAVTRRETNGWKWPAFMLTYLFVLAYIAAGATFWAATALGL